MNGNFHPGLRWTAAILVLSLLAAIAPVRSADAMDGSAAERNGAAYLVTAQAIAQRVLPGAGPRITRIVPKQKGYIIFGVGFGNKKAAIKVIEGTKTLPARAIAQVRDTRIDVRSKAAGRVRIRVKRGRFETKAVAVTFGSPARAAGRPQSRQSRGGSRTGTVPSNALSRMLAAKQAARAAKQAGKSADDAAKDQKNVHRASPQQALKNLLDGGYVLDRSLGAVHRIFKRPAEFTLSLLKALNIGVREAVLAGTRTFRNKSAAWFLENLAKTGYDTKDLTFNLKGVKNLTAHVAAVTFKKLGKKAAPAMRILKDVFGLSKEAAVRILKGARYGVKEMWSALKSVFGATAEATTALLNKVYRVGAPAAAIALKGEGWAVEKSTAALDRVYNLPINSMALIQKAAGWSSGKVADALKLVLNASDRATTIAMKGAGWAEDHVSMALNKTYGLRATATTRVMKSAGFGATKIARGIKRTYNRTAPQTARILADAGFPIGDIKNAIIGAFNMTLARVVSMLARAGIR